MAEAKDVESAPAAPSTFTLVGDIYLDADRKKVVPGDSDKAAVRLGGKGKVIPLARARQLGLVKAEKD